MCLYSVLAFFLTYCIWSFYLKSKPLEGFQLLKEKNSDSKCFYIWICSFKVSTRDRKFQIPHFMPFLAPFFAFILLPCYLEQHSLSQHCGEILAINYNSCWTLRTFCQKCITLGTNDTTLYLVFVEHPYLYVIDAPTG